MSNQNLREFFPESALDKAAAANPELQKLLDILASPEFAAFVEAKHYGTDAYFDFLQSQGISLDKGKYYRSIQKDFQKHFPGETPEGIEPEMRQTLRRIIIAAMQTLDHYGIEKGLQQLKQSDSQFAA